MWAVRGMATVRRVWRSIKERVTARVRVDSRGLWGSSYRFKRGQTAIDTGGHSGIGLETPRTSANAGVAIVVGSRPLEKACESIEVLPM